MKRRISFHKKLIGIFRKTLDELQEYKEIIYYNISQKCL